MRRAISLTNAIWALAHDRFVDDLFSQQFPRNIEALAIYGLDIPIIRLPSLTLQDAANYICMLRDDDALANGETNSRPLYGLLHVGPPTNIIFIQDGLSSQITNYVLAHELGHFMGDIFSVRQLWSTTMPEKKAIIENVFNWQEHDPELELAAVIKGLPPRPKTITSRGTKIIGETTKREIQADLIARELIAPWDIASAGFLPDAQQMTNLLHQQFGLPWRVATQYCDDLRQCLLPYRDTVDRLFTPLL